MAAAARFLRSFATQSLATSRGRSACYATDAPRKKSPMAATDPTAVDRPRHAVQLRDGGFRVRHRASAWHEFTWQWSTDLYGVELWHRGRKVAEVCGPDRVFADFAGCELPDRVVEVATLAYGVLVWAIRESVPPSRRPALLAAELAGRGLERFRVLAD